ncbi:hypothetical protein AB0N62_42855 [Streptomyces sp. NPDC093982]|uniref:hypothetical protein n=1 Tax=Streptomyces sp. NPDC093982 TaxID=3155077 RepID=UPI003447BD5F
MTEQPGDPVSGQQTTDSALQAVDPAEPAAETKTPATDQAGLTGQLSTPTADPIARPAGDPAVASATPAAAGWSDLKLNPGQQLHESGFSPEEQQPPGNAVNPDTAGVQASPGTQAAADATAQTDLQAGGGQTDWAGLFGSGGGTGDSVSTPADQPALQADQAQQYATDQGQQGQLGSGGGQGVENGWSQLTDQGTQADLGQPLAA